MYRVRKQAFTGKLILQIETSCGWQDMRTQIGGPFSIIDIDTLGALHARVAKYERRAEGQRNSRKARLEQA